MIDLKTDFFTYQDNFKLFEDIKSRCLFGGVDLLDTVRVTIAIPTYKRSLLLKEALISSLYQIGYSNYCIVVIDNDNQIDNETHQLIKSLNNNKIIYYQNEKNIGMFGNQNRCFELPHSEWILLLHDDDILMPHYLCTCMEILNAHSNIDALQPQRLYLKNSIVSQNDKKHVHKLTKVKALSNYLCFLPGTQSCGLFKREIMMKLGGFNADYYPSSDYCLGILMAKHYNYYICNEYLSIYRYENNASLSPQVINQTIYNDYHLKHFLFRQYAVPSFVSKSLVDYMAKRIIDKNTKENSTFHFDNSVIISNVPKILFYLSRLYIEVVLKIKKE